VGYADQWNLYAYVGNNPLNATDPTGKCDNDPQCDGDFTPDTRTASANQSGRGLQDQYNEGTGAEYVVDPAAHQLNLSIDIGTQIQQGVNAPGSAWADVYDRAVANGGSASFADIRTRFNGERDAWVPGSGQPSARSLGRVVGLVSGDMVVAPDGSFELNATIEFFDNPYSWVPDSTRTGVDGLVHDLAIWAVGNTMRTAPESRRTNEFMNNLEGHRIRRNDGVPVPISFNRAYEFESWGARR
jgi:hypothetical protein